MSAPDTNIDKQKKRHAGSLIGMGAAAAIAAILLIIYLLTVSGSGDELPGATAGTDSDAAPSSETMAPAEGN